MSDENTIPRGPGRTTFLILAVVALLLFACLVLATITRPTVPPESQPTPTEGLLTSTVEFTSTRLTTTTRTKTPSATWTPRLTYPPTSTQTRERPTLRIVTRTPTRTYRPTATRTPTPRPLCVVVADAVNLRRGPGTVYVPPIEVLKRSAQLRPMAFSAVGYPDGRWIKGQLLPGGPTGWISADPELVSCNIDVESLPTETGPPTPTFTPTPSIAFKADRASIKVGECTTLRWDVDNVLEVYLDGQGVAGHDSRRVCPRSTQTYTLRVKKRSGEETRQVTIEVEQVVVINFRADSTNLSAGQCTILRWDVDNVLAVYLDGQGVAGHGTKSVCLSASKTYNLRVRTAAGEQTRQVTINVQRDTSGPSISSVIATPESVSYGECGIQKLRVDASVHDSSGVDQVTLMYRFKSDDSSRPAGPWRNRTMSRWTTDRYAVTFDVGNEAYQDMGARGGVIELRVSASDNARNTSYSGWLSVRVRYCIG